MYTITNLTSNFNFHIPKKNFLKILIEEIAKKALKYFFGIHFGKFIVHKLKTYICHFNAFALIYHFPYNFLDFVLNKHFKIEARNIS